MRQCPRTSERLARAALAVALQLLLCSLAAASPQATTERPLPPGGPIVEELSGGETHVYRARLEKDQVCEITVEQQGADVVLRAFGPDLARLAEVDGPTGATGAESVFFIASSTGEYRVEVAAFDPKAPRGRYTITLAPPRPATAEDRRRAEAAQATAAARASANEAARLWSLGTSESRAKALSMFEEAMARCRAAGAEEAEAELLVNLGYLHYWAQDWATAERHFTRALAIQERLLGPDAVAIVLTLNGLALVHDWGKWDRDEAERLYLRALAIGEKARDTFLVTTELNNLGALYLNRRDFTRAEHVLGRARELLDTLPNKGPLEKQIEYLVRTQLAIVYAEKGEYEKAVPIAEAELAANERQHGAESRPALASLILVGSLSLARGDLAAADATLTRAEAIERKVRLPEDPPNFALASLQLQIALLQNDLPRAVALLSELEEGIERLITRNLPLASAKDRDVYLTKFLQMANASVALHAQLAPDRRDALRLAATTVLRRKGRALDTVAESVALLRARGDDESTRALVDRLAEVRAALASAVLKGTGTATAAEREAALARMEAEASALEVQIGVATGGDRARLNPITIEAVQAAIPEDAILVEYFRYQPVNLSATRQEDALAAARYIAYVLARTGDPKWVDLGDAGQIDERVQSLRDVLRSPRSSVERQVRPQARALDRLVMQPVRAIAGGTRRLLLSPDGALNLVPFAALVDERGEYLVERYAISYVTGGRDLLRRPSAGSGRSESLVVAAPDFGPPPEAAPAGGRGGLLQGAIFGPLPGAGAEAREITKLLAGSRVLGGPEATEAALKSADGPKVLHVATHGFFLSDARAAPTTTSTRELVLGAAGRPNVAGGEPNAARGVAVDPLLRSGLALAGANAREAGRDDGVLTALEAASLDLQGTELVVLSACDTGVGEVRNGSGVYGLRRALVLAGAETQVMTLWPVSDAGTRDLMIDYYRRLAGAEGRADAMRGVQLGMLRDPRRRHPFYWASCIVSGDWRPLRK